MVDAELPGSERFLVLSKMLMGRHTGSERKLAADC